jgi:hypothetical protein
MPGLRQMIYQKKGSTQEATGVEPEANYNAYTFILKGLDVGIDDTEYTKTEKELYQAFFWNHEKEEFNVLELRSLFVLTIHEGVSFDSFALEEAFFKQLSEMLEVVSGSSNAEPMETFNQENSGRYSLAQGQEERVNHAYAVGEMRLFQHAASLKKMPGDTRVEIEVSRMYQHG